MNDRIKELAKQTMYRDQFGLWSADDVDLEKFAELLIRECIDTLMKPSVMEWDEGLRAELSDYNRGWVSGRLLGIEHIKEQFGIK